MIQSVVNYFLLASTRKIWWRLTRFEKEKRHISDFRHGDKISIKYIQRIIDQTPYLWYFRTNKDSRKTLRPIKLTEKEFEKIFLILKKTKLIKFNDELTTKEKEEGYIVYTID